MTKRMGVEDQKQEDKGSGGNRSMSSRIRRQESEDGNVYANQKWRVSNSQSKREEESYIRSRRGGRQEQKLNRRIGEQEQKSRTRRKRIQEQEQQNGSGRTETERQEQKSKSVRVCARICYCFSYRSVLLLFWSQSRTPTHPSSYSYTYFPTLPLLFSHSYSYSLENQYNSLEIIFLSLLFSHPQCRTHPTPGPAPTHASPILSCPWPYVYSPMSIREYSYIPIQGLL